MTDAVHFHWDRGKARVIAAGGIAVAALGLALLLQEDAGAKVLGLLWTLSFGALSLTLLRRARDPAPVVTVDAAGLIDRRLLDHIIPWSEIEAVERIEAEHVVVVGLELKRSSPLFGELSALHRLMRWPNRLFRFPSLSIAMNALNGSAADLLDAIARFRPDLVREP